MNEENLKAENEAFEQKEKHEKKLKRCSKGKSKTIELSEYIMSIARALRKDGKGWLYEDAYALQKCGSWLVFRNFYTVGKTKLQGGFFCQKPMLCGLCAIIRAAKELRAYVPKVKQVLKDNHDLKLIFITLTVKNGLDLRERFEHLKKNVSVMVNRRRKIKNNQRSEKTVFEKVEGAVWSYEITNIGNGWHPHLHSDALIKKSVDIKEFEKELRSEWNELTKDSFEIDVQEIESEEQIIKSIVETFKYTLKMNEMKKEDQVEAYTILKGKRMVESLGLLRGVKLDSKLDDDIDDEIILPYIDMVYKYVQGEGYKFIEYLEKEEISLREKKQEAIIRRKEFADLGKRTYK